MGGLPTMGAARLSAGALRPVAEGAAWRSSAVAPSEQPQPKRVELNEALGIPLVIGAGIVLERHHLLTVKAVPRLAAGDMHATLVKLQPDGAVDPGLAMVDGRLQHLPFRREPEPVVDQLGIARHQLILEMRGTTVEGHLLDRAMSGV